MDAKIEYTMLFEDDTTQKISIGNYNGNDYLSDATLYALKNNIKNFNGNFGSDTALLAISKYGANWSGISAARVIVTDKTVLF